MSKVLGMALIFTVMLFASSCEELIDPITCDGCDSTLPYSHSGASTCYSTKAACEAAEGVTCVICN